MAAVQPQPWLWTLIATTTTNNNNYTLHVSDGLSVHHQESKTAHTASGICHSEIPKMGTVTSECIYVKKKR
jgi:hypothetical protein